MKKKMPYSTPEGYFDNLESRLNEIPMQASSVRKVQKITPYLALAASFAIAFLIGGTVLHKTVTPTATEQVNVLSAASNEDIVEYLIDSNITLAQIEEYLTYNE